jgi:hypothetical protein
MPLENADGKIGLLDDTWPLGGETKTQGDDHIRMIKNVLKTIFPGSGGNGFIEPIIASEAEINHLDGVTGNIQTQINNLAANLYAPVNTVMLFIQSAAPSGWSLVNSYADRVLRVIGSGGTGGSTGGSWTISGLQADAYALEEWESGVNSHYHVQPGLQYVGSGGSYQITPNANGNFHYSTTYTTGQPANKQAATAHQHGVTHTPGWRPAYVDAIPCKKI